MASPEPLQEATAFPQPQPLDPQASGVYQGLAEELLPRLPGGCARLVLADPPYNVSRRNNFTSMGRTGIDFDWDGDFDQLAWLEHADRVLVRGGSIVIWNDWKNLGDLARALDQRGYSVKSKLTWWKNNPMPRNRDRSFVPREEHALWAVKPGAKWVFDREETYEDGVFRHPVPRVSGGPRHQAKKPDAMFRKIIRLLTEPGELVVDPFAGGGTTAYAAEVESRRHISFEKDEKWCHEAQRHWRETHAESGAASGNPEPSSTGSEAEVDLPLWNLD